MTRQQELTSRRTSGADETTKAEDEAEGKAAEVDELPAPEEEAKADVDDEAGGGGEPSSSDPYAARREVMVVVGGVGSRSPRSAVTPEMVNTYKADLAQVVRLKLG